MTWMITEADKQTLRELYGDEGGAIALAELEHWLMHGSVPLGNAYIQSVEFARDGSLIIVHKDWSD